MPNPVMMNDLRGSWIRRKPVLAVAFAAALILLLTLSAAAFPSMLFGFGNSSFPLWRFPDIVLPAVAPAFAAGAFAKEHEQRTWQDLLLTRLKPGEIVAGKFWAALIPTIGMVIVLFPPFAMVLIVQNISWALDFGPWIAVVLFRFAVMAVLYLAVSMLCSYHNTNTRVSLAVCYAVLGLYLFASYFGVQIVVAAVDMFTGTPTATIPGVTAANGSSSATNGIAAQMADAANSGFSSVDTAMVVQALLLVLCIYWYLRKQIHERRGPMKAY